MLLSIIIANYKNPALLRLCLKTVKRELGRDFDYETIVIDSASQPETRNVVTHEFPDFKLLAFKENLGYTRGNNEGIKISAGEYVLILNSDVVLDRKNMEALLKYMTANPDIGMAGPKLLNFDGSKQDSCFRYYTPLTILHRRIAHLPFAKKTIDRFLMRNVPLDKPFSVDWLMGSACLVSRQAIEKVGLMDEKLFLYFSDVDWARRFWENGYKVVYYPESVMYHHLHRNSKGRLGILDAFFKRESRWHIADAIRYFKKWGISTPPSRT
ncbi:MAG: hypothetical protein A2750_03635 [Candidatus Yanofskybacteria bacterium RIFCSPHIGHO2_01_FULL_45_42]|uniref:Glycosyltransferase 2-like domain-containing protein n=3 Tax=Candidatus Yanofskyibacteriota TaxID=1752733 RepID=A0A1F8H4X4_9BACT|nr:MAG: hypothetical protein A2750_03635 [Candidatus Yanofskybacteria bacterium RIFCSPHIGHO2_01_FULL_45_42]OGN16876.1 MAG: hypothetical protein A3C81_03185 [Candidatus Yanofskybacteria bacterium RIFCSPHIGHO2_02_FULL_46_19]OGN27563.1 MAG: hypothetical protein A3B17_00835 [Candidatus Yanofskybacteria bacterium RIFCSPLOWO2_01_FULL_45_72]OGN32028.1 MAG: hypothetical protein A3J01_03045 [Candidatus Yanofskybacteria bacterium RIFCSPLOWO2_02_FULL_45_18]